MKKFINFVILLGILYVVVLIYRGNGVVDFNAVWIEIKSIYYYVLLNLKLV